MSKVYANVNTAADNWQTLITRTNQLVDTLATEIVTANGDVNGGLTVGNVAISGIVSGTTLVSNTMRGGTVAVVSPLTLASNVSINTSFSLIAGNTTINSSVFSVGSNVTVNTSVIKVGNSTINLAVNSSTLSTGNSTVNATALLHGNTTFYGMVNATSLFVTNSTIYSILSPGSITLGNSTVNTVITSVGIAPGGIQSIAFGDATANLTANALQMSVANSLGRANLSPIGLVAGQVTANLIGITVGNSTTNMIANSVILQVSNSTGVANLQPTQLVIGTTTVNTSVITLGANVVANTSAILVGNSTVNLVANNTRLTLSNATFQTTVLLNQYTTGNSTANLNANSTQTLLANSTFSMLTNPGGMQASNATQNTTINAAGITVGNTVGALGPVFAFYANSTFLRLGNSSNHAIQSNSSATYTQTLNVSGTATVTGAVTSTGVTSTGGVGVQINSGALNALPGVVTYCQSGVNVYNGHIQLLNAGYGMSSAAYHQLWSYNFSYRFLYQGAEGTCLLSNNGYPFIQQLASANWQIQYYGYSHYFLSLQGEYGIAYGDDGNGFRAASDGTLKEDIETLPVLKRLRKSNYRTTKFKWKKSTDTTRRDKIRAHMKEKVASGEMHEIALELHERKMNENTHGVGVIHQEMEKWFPEVTSIVDLPVDLHKVAKPSDAKKPVITKPTRLVNYNQVAALAMMAAKELADENTELQNTIKALSARLDALEKKK